jgi:hypothetical protein
MNKYCKKCSVDPDSHSFKKVGERGGKSIYYTKPGSSKLYKDKDGFIEHVDNILSCNKKPWICIVDGDDFDVRHATEFDIGRAIIDLICTKYYHNMAEIIVINPTWHIEGALHFAELLLTPEMISKIKTLKDRRYSILEFI